MIIRCSSYQVFFVTCLSIVLCILTVACTQKTASNDTTSKMRSSDKTSNNTQELITLQDIASYEGADRTERLIASAKKEGTVNLYTSIAQNSTEKLVSDFEKRYGIKVNVWRAGSTEVLQKIISESQAGKNNFNVVHIASPEMEALHREKILQVVKSPFVKDILSSSNPSHKEWTSTTMTVYVQAYNTNIVKKEDLPKTYQDA